MGVAVFVVDVMPQWKWKRGVDAGFGTCIYIYTHKYILYVHEGTSGVALSFGFATFRG